WFFQNPVSDPGLGGTFTAHRMVGDILVVAAFPSTGGLPSIQAYKWVGPGGDTSSLQLLPTNSNNLLGITNSTSTPSGAWPFTSKFSAPSNTFLPGEFFEGGIDLTALGQTNCFASLVAETRASDSLDSVLKDFVLGNLNTCADLAVGKTVSNPRPNVNDTVT